MWLLEDVMLLLVEGEGRWEGWVRRDVELRHLSGCDGALRLQHMAVFCGAQSLTRDPLWQNLRVCCGAIFLESFVFPRKTLCPGGGRVGKSRLAAVLVTHPDVTTYCGS